MKEIVRARFGHSAERRLDRPTFPVLMRGNNRIQLASVITILVDLSMMEWHGADQAVGSK
jgi:hypothetical protein